MFQRRHYKEIANIIRHITFVNEQGDKYILLVNLLDELSTLFQRDNPNFNEDKFVEACSEDKEAA